MDTLSVRDRDGSLGGSYRAGLAEAATTWEEAGWLP